MRTGTNGRSALVDIRLMAGMGGKRTLAGAIILIPDRAFPQRVYEVIRGAAEAVSQEAAQIQQPQPTPF